MTYNRHSTKFLFVISRTSLTGGLLYQGSKQLGSLNHQAYFTEKNQIEAGLFPGFSVES